MSYVMTVQAGDITFTTGPPVDASIVVRAVDFNGTSTWQIVEWRDDV